MWTRLNFQYLNQWSVCGLLKKNKKTDPGDMLDKQRKKKYTSELKFCKSRRSLNICKSLSCSRPWEKVWRRIQVKQHWVLQILLREMSLQGNWGRYKEETKHAKWLSEDREMSSHSHGAHIVWLLKTTEFTWLESSRLKELYQGLYNCQYQKNVCSKPLTLQSQ